jgi:hypothetical protein
VKKLYLITRDLHLCIGLFISPFVLMFAIRVFLLVHPAVPGTSKPPVVRTAGAVRSPPVRFVSIGGIYLWVVLRAERRTGLALIVAGGVRTGKAKRRQKGSPLIPRAKLTDSSISWTSSKA